MAETATQLEGALRAALKAYTHEEWAEITGYSIATLRQWSSQGHPAWKHRRWHPVAWLAWSCGVLGQQRRGRPREKNIPAEARQEAFGNVVRMVMSAAAGGQ